MQSRLVSVEEGKEPSTKPRGLPLRVLRFLLFSLGIGVAFTFTSLYMIKYVEVPNAVHQVIQFSSLFCHEDIKSLKSWIKPPSSLIHNMNDDELFWRASFSPRIEAYPFERTPKIAFMFLTRGPLPLAPLWERFFKGHEGHYSVYVHTLPDYQPNYTESSVFYRRQIPSQLFTGKYWVLVRYSYGGQLDLSFGSLWSGGQAIGSHHHTCDSYCTNSVHLRLARNKKAEWGEMSMCDAERRLLANALLDFSNEWFILLSEACIPLQNFSIIYRYISRSRYSFIGSFDEYGLNGRGRYHPKMAPEINLSDWRKGSQWFEVSRDLALDIIEDNYFYPKFEEFCKPECYVDEHYFPTMLSIQTPHLLANRSITYADWSRKEAHPATFGKNDINEELFMGILEGNCMYNNQPSMACYLFARKFAPSALEPLLEIASNVFGF